MTTKAYVEFGFISSGFLNSGPPFPRIIESMVGARVVHTITLTDDTDSDEITVPAPTIPAGADAVLASYVAFVTPVGGNVVVDWGTAPDANQTTGKLVLANVELTIPVRPGDKISIALLS